MTNEQEKQLIEQMSRIEELLKPETKSLTTSVKESSRDWTNDFLFHTLFEQYTEWARELVRIGLEASIVFALSHSVLIVAALALLSSSTTVYICRHRIYRVVSKSVIIHWEGPFTYEAE